MKRITVALDDEELYQALKMYAAQEGRTLREVINEALELWVEAKEDAEDAAFAEAAMQEQGESIPWEDAKPALSRVEGKEMWDYIH